MRVEAGGFRKRALALSLVAAVPVGACAIAPLPEDVSGLNTFQIVNRIRCEARNSIKERGVHLLRDDERASTQDRAYWSEFLDRNGERWREIPLGRFSPETRSLVAKYDDARIHMDFTFTIKEENNLTAELNFLSTLRFGTDALKVGGTNNRSRQNVRNFRVKDSFAGLLTEKLTCAGSQQGKNYMYPITGAIGLQEVIWTFLDLNEARNLASGDKANLMTDTRTFKTTIVGSVAPKIILSPVGKALSLADAGFTAEAKRDDEHEVLIGLSLPEEKLAARGVAPARRVPTPAPLLLPSARLGVSTDRTIHTYQLDQLMNFQLERNAIRRLGDPRPIDLRLF